jgi:hypothetical protein
MGAPFTPIYICSIQIWPGEPIERERGKVGSGKRQFANIGASSAQSAENSGRVYTIIIMK